VAREDILRKVKALLAKEGAGGTTPEEVAAALALATRLLESEGLTRAALELVNSNSFIEKESAQIFNEPLFGKPEKSKSSWRIRLASVLSRRFGCFCYITGGATFIVGCPSDADTIRYLFAYCEKEIDRITLTNCKGEGKTYSNNFRIGCIDAISESIEAEVKSERMKHQASAVNERALMIINNAIAQIDAKHSEAEKFAYAKLRLGKPTSMSYRSDYGAREAGRSAGESIYPSSGSSRVGAGYKRLT
jgi:Protein of unknown function (DUF2786)